MFSKPEYGWTNFELGGFKGRCSYLTDVPVDCLDAFIGLLKDNISASVFFDEEGSDFTLEVSKDEVYIIVDRDSVSKVALSISYIPVIQEFIKDMETYLNDWAIWNIVDNWDGSYESKEFKDSKANLEVKLKELKKLLANKVK